MTPPKCCIGHLPTALLRSGPRCCIGKNGVYNSGKPTTMVKHMVRACKRVRTVASFMVDVGATSTAIGKGRVRPFTRVTR